MTSIPIDFSAVGLEHAEHLSGGAQDLPGSGCIQPGVWWCFNITFPYFR